MPPVKNRVKGKQPKIYIGGIFSDGGGFIISVDVWGHLRVDVVDCVAVLQTCEK